MATQHSQFAIRHASTMLAGLSLLMFASLVLLVCP
jgi:hypothetical protein